MQKNVLIGKYHDDIRATDQPRFTWSTITRKPGKYFVLHDIYKRDSKEVAPEIHVLDLQGGCDQPPGTHNSEPGWFAPSL
jgi:hypothetical protein